MASKLTAKTNGSRGGVHHFLQAAAYLEHQSRVYQPYNHIRQPLGSGNMALSSKLHIAGPWQGWQHNAVHIRVISYPDLRVPAKMQRRRHTHRQEYRVLSAGYSQNWKLVQSCNGCALPVQRAKERLGLLIL
jgi:uncharacterized protein YcaQ